jgi:pyruvate carboxylase
MGGLCKPAAARKLVTALKQEIGIPIHFHTHDTSGIAAASVLAAVEAGVDAADGAMGAMSGLTSQPNLGSIAEALVGDPRDPGLDRAALRAIDNYWEGVRHLYAPFESDMRAGTASVFVHGMPGGQYTNLREQARSLGLEHHWPDVETAYAQVNQLLGDIIKVTPTSKVVGDMALYMVTNDLTPEQVADPDHEVAFPESMVQLMRGDMGQPPGGFPEALQRKVLKGETPLAERPGAVLPAVDLDAERAALEHKIRRQASDRDLAAYLMYPQVFLDYAEHRRQHGPVQVLPTDVFFYGMVGGQEIAVEIDPGKTLIVKYLAVGEPDEAGKRTVFFELNGQPRTVKVQDRALAAPGHARRKADESQPGQVGAPMPGMIVSVSAAEGQQVQRGDRLFTIEAMKMETAIYAEIDGEVEEVVSPSGTRVDSHDLVLVIKPI